jgi:enoyl-CoA hydratase
MEFENLRLVEEGPVLLITLDRETSLNALNMATMRSLRQVFGQFLPEREDIRGVIITGAGSKAFAAGADIKEFQGLSPQQGRELAAAGHETFFLIEQSPIPVIAAVNGFALGGGCELAMACHLRVSGEHARFGQPEVNLGLIPGYGGTQRLIQYIGKGKAMELLMTAEMINAQQALEWGLVNHVVPAGQEVAKARELLAKILTKGPVAIRKVIEAVNAYFTESTDGFHFEVESFGYTTGTEDFREGASAFVEKRKPEFKGH